MVVKNSIFLFKIYLLIFLFYLFYNFTKTLKHFKYMWLPCDVKIIISDDFFFFFCNILSRICYCNPWSTMTVWISQLCYYLRRNIPERLLLWKLHLFSTIFVSVFWAEFSIVTHESQWQYEYSSCVIMT